jgi:cytochrome c oxidase subunit II
MSEGWRLPCYHPRSAVRVIQLVSLALAIVAAACSGSSTMLGAGPQSALSAAGRDAEQIDGLFRLMTVGALLIWCAVVAIAVYTIRVGESHSQRAANLLILGGGVAVPAVVLGALIAYGMPLVPRVLAIPGNGPSIRVTAKQWWWRFEYVTRDGLVETANELRLPVGERVALELASPDVIHSFWVPSLAGKMDMIPGRLTRLALEPTRTGTFRGTCAEYCGASHALMAFTVVVMEPEDFRAWVAEQARPAVAATDPLMARGQMAFIANGCTACHTIRGTPAAGRIGPDLTHVGSRRQIAAETLPNDRAALTRWIAEADAIKPGVHMPAFRALERDELSALAAYLSGLK